MPSSVTSQKIPEWVMALRSVLKIFTLCIRYNNCFRYYYRAAWALSPFIAQTALTAPRAQSTVKSLTLILRPLQADRLVEPQIGLALTLTPMPIQKQNLSSQFDALTKLPQTFLFPMKMSLIHLQLTNLLAFEVSLKQDLMVFAVWLAISIGKYRPNVNSFSMRRVRYMLLGGLLHVLECCPRPQL